MLDMYLEKNIQNKLELFNILRAYNSVTMADLISLTSLSAEYIHTLVNELNMDLAGLASIKKSFSCFMVQVHEQVTNLQLLHCIYQSSNVLHCLKFMILNERNRSLTAFIEDRYLTKSSAYRLREQCGKYLRCIGLTLNGNHVTGEEYRIRFLIALLHYKYGINCYEITKEDLRITRNFILSTNRSIDQSYTESASNEYGYFECLFILLWKRKNFSVGPIISSHLEACKKIFIYEKLKTALKVFEPQIPVSLDESDCDYIYLVFCATNSLLFADQWTQKDIQDVHEMVFSDPAFSDLLQRIGEKLGKEIADSHVLRAALVYFYKKCLLELQCIIPDKNFYISSRKNHLTQMIFEAISDNLEEWRKQQNRKYAISKGHIFYLSLQLELIIKQFLKPVPVFVLSELNAELELTTLYLKHLFPPERATIQPFFIGTKDICYVCSQKNSVIVINRKFRYLIEKWNLSEDNIVIPVTVELSSQELIYIQKAIMHYETENFLDFIDHM